MNPLQTDQEYLQALARLGMVSQGGRRMKPKDEMDATANRHAYRVRYREVICRSAGKCSYCPWHGRENRGPLKRTAKAKKVDHR